MSTAPLAASASATLVTGLGWPDPAPGPDQATSAGLGWPPDPPSTAHQPAQETS
jgi:hypothetical protein